MTSPSKRLHTRPYGYYTDHVWQPRSRMDAEAQGWSGRCRGCGEWRAVHLLAFTPDGRLVRVRGGAAHAHISVRASWQWAWRQHDGAWGVGLVGNYGHIGGSHMLDVRLQTPVGAWTWQFYFHSVVLEAFYARRNLRTKGLLV